VQKGTFDYTSLEKAYKKLGDILERFKKEENDEAVRDSVIQRFEFTYSITLKTIRKYFIDKAFVIEDVNQMSFNDMIRTANELNILQSNLETWTTFREMRNLTSHTYDEVIAKKVLSIVPSFYNEISWLLNALKGNNG